MVDEPDCRRYNPSFLILATEPLIREPNEDTEMANSLGAKKRIRRTERRTVINRNRRGRIRTYVRKVEEAIAGGDQDAARVALVEAQPEIMRGVGKGIYHRNTASRKISRLAKRVKAMSG